MTTYYELPRGRFKLDLVFSSPKLLRMSSGIDPSELMRYQRQLAFAPLGPQGQRKLIASGAVIVGVGGLGSWVAELLARAGVGTLRLVDDDEVDLTNLHRQALYDQDDARAQRPKVRAAADHLVRVNSGVAVEPVEACLDAGNVEDLARGMQLIIDGTDNFAARFIINDFAVKTGLPWVFAGVVGGEAQTMTIVPGRTACLRCVYESPPPPCVDPSCRGAGVLGPAVAAIAAIQAFEAVKILAGRIQSVSPYLTKLDLWTNRVQQIDTTEAAREVRCPCCKERIFDFLE